MSEVSGSKFRSIALGMAVASVALLGTACVPPGGGPSCTDTVLTIQPGTPGNTPASYPASGWWSAETRTNGTVDVNTDLAAPPGFGCKSAKLTTGAATGSPLQDKAQLFNFSVANTGTLLASINTISYWANRSSGGPAATVALNVQITGTGVPTGFATLVCEPYNQSGGQGAIVNGTWQYWNATATTPGDGLWWSNKIPSGPGSQGSPMTWAAFQTAYPLAEIGGYGLNLGSNNPFIVAAADGLQFGATTTDF